MLNNYIHQKHSQIFKNGVNMSIFPEILKDYNIVYEEVEEGHFEEFLNKKSTFSWFIFEGNGIFFINKEEYRVTKGDFISIPPNNKIYYIGKMKMLLICSPKFDQADELHIRNIEH